MNLKQIIFTNSDCYKAGVVIEPCGIGIHSTGASNTELRRYVQPDDGMLGKNLFNNHWNQPMSRRVCAHAFVGRQKDGTLATIQTLPWTMRTWTSGSGSKGNANTLGYIQWEVCEDNRNDKDYALETYRESVELAAYLCDMFGWDPHGKTKEGYPVIADHALLHSLGIASNHADIFPWWYSKHKLTIEQFRNDVKAKMKEGVIPVPKPEKFPYTIRLEQGTPYYAGPSTLVKAGAIEVTTNYTIVDEEGNFGRLKSGAGWVQIKDDPAPPKPTPTPTPPKPEPVPRLVDTWARANMIKQGSKGKHVEILQAALQMRGYDVQAIDGTFGSVTNKQVKAFQKDQGLTVDGIVGYETWPVILHK